MEFVNLNLTPLWRALEIKEYWNFSLLSSLSLSLSLLFFEYHTILEFTFDYLSLLLLHLTDHGIFHFSPTLYLHSSLSSSLVGSLTHLESGATPLLGSHEALESEVKRLRERLHTVESENFTLSAKLTQQQREVEHRLAEIEMQICGASSHGSVSSQDMEQEDTERNRESII